METTTTVTDLLQNLLTRFHRGGKHTYLLPALDTLWAVTVQEGRLLSRLSVPLADPGDETALTEAFMSLKKQGLGNRSLLLLSNFSSSRVSIRKFPDMTADELAETVEWEVDRIFGSRESYRTAWRVLSHSPQGYTLLLHALPEDIMDLWSSAAKDAGFHLRRTIPVMDIPLAAGPHFVLYERNSTAVFLYREGRRVESRLLSRAEPGKAALFFRHILGLKEMKPVPLYTIPFAGTGRSQWEAWRSWMMADIEAYEAEPTAGEESTAPQTRVVLAEEAIQDKAHPEWDVLLPLCLHGAESEASFQKESSLPEEDDRQKWIRPAMGAAAAAFLFFLVATGTLLHARKELLAAQEEAAALAPVQAEFQKQQAESRYADELLAFLKTQDTRWSSRLLTLPDLLPEGVVLRSLSGSSGTFHLEGTAQSGESISLFRSRLESSWGGHARIAKRKGNSLTHLQEFVVEWQPAEDEAKSQK